MNLNETLNHLSEQPNSRLDIAEIALHLARDEYPGLDVEAYLGEVNSMAHEARRYLRGDLDARLTGLCRYLFHEVGFRGNTRSYYDPRNSYFNVVLERRTGIPISLTAVAMAVGRRAGLEVHGIGLPGHFIACAFEGGEEILFDPFHGGRRLSHTDCENLVEQITGMPFRVEPFHLLPVPTGAMVQRMLNNLKAIYLGEEDFPRGIQVIRRLQQLDPKNPLHDRDLGACYLHARQPGKAIDLLSLYLSKVPDAQDRPAVENLIGKARRVIAEWN